jgi:LysM repeat protein
MRTRQECISSMPIADRKAWERRAGVARQHALRMLAAFGLVLATSCTATAPSPTAPPTAGVPRQPPANPTLASASTSPSPSPSPSRPAPATYVTQEGDVLWAVAMRFHVTLDELLALNPQANPEGLLPAGLVLALPPHASAPLEIPAPAWPYTAQVPQDEGTQELRQLPAADAAPQIALQPLTPLNIIGRSIDRAWLEACTPLADRGWLRAADLLLFTNPGLLPIIRDPSLSPASFVGAPYCTPPDSPADAPLRPSPYLSGIGEHLIEIYQLGLQLGNRPGVFSKVGDSITVTEAFLTDFGTGHYDLHEHLSLQPALNYFCSSWARTHTPFANRSLAAGGGWSSNTVLKPAHADPAICLPGETPLACEYRIVRPSIAIIMLGTNGVMGLPAEDFAQSMRPVIEETLARGIIPLLNTIPPLQRPGMQGKVEAYNAVLRGLADEYRIPLLNYWSALLALPNQGLSADGIHPSEAPAGHNADLSPANLRYGMPLRNLLTLQALDALWRLLAGSAQTTP